MKVLMSNKIEGKDWNATITLTETYPASGHTLYEATMEMTEAYPYEDNCISKILQNERVVKQLSKRFRDTATERDFRKGDDDKRLTI
jgi:hypothetical protein